MRRPAKVAVVQWLRMQVLGMEVPSLNFGKVFLTFFVHFLPRGDCYIRVSRFHDLHLLSFCLITLSL